MIKLHIYDLKMKLVRMTTMTMYKIETLFGKKNIRSEVEILRKNRINFIYFSG